VSTRGTTVLRDPALRRVRVLAVLNKKLSQNMSNQDIAKSLNISPDTVDRDIDYAKRQGMLIKFEDQLLENLVPLAMTAVKQALSDGNVPAALEVLKGSGVLRKQSAAPLVTPAPQEDTLEFYVKSVRQGGAADGARLPETPTGTSSANASGAHQNRSLGPAIIEAEVVAPGAEDRAPSDESHTGISIDS